MGHKQPLLSRRRIYTHLYLLQSQQLSIGLSNFVIGQDGKPFAVIKAKKTSKGAELGREQAKQYSQNIERERCSGQVFLATLLEKCSQ